jgi:hypothetical protein
MDDAAVKTVVSPERPSLWAESGRLPVRTLLFLAVLTLAAILIAGLNHPSPLWLLVVVGARLFQKFFVWVVGPLSEKPAPAVPQPPPSRSGVWDRELDAQP